MKTFCLFSILFLIASTCLTAQNACPVNFDSKKLITAEQNIDTWNGQIVAFNATVLQVNKGHINKPYYKVEIEGGGSIWVGSLISSGYEIQGKNLRILGYFADVGNDNVAKKYNNKRYHVLAFAVIDLSTKKMSMHPETKLQVQDWVNGVIPKAKNK